MVMLPLLAPRGTTTVPFPTKVQLMSSRATGEGATTGENPGNCLAATALLMVSLVTVLPLMAIRSLSAPFATTTTAVAQVLPISSNATAEVRTTGAKPVNCWPAMAQQRIFSASASASMGIRQSSAPNSMTTRDHSPAPPISFPAIRKEAMPGVKSANCSPATERRMTGLDTVWPFRATRQSSAPISRT